MVTVSLTREQFNAKAATLAEKGLLIVGDKGTLRAKGAVVDYSYDPGSGQLMMTVERAAWLHTASQTEQKIREWFGVA